MQNLQHLAFPSSLLRKSEIFGNNPIAFTPLTISKGIFKEKAGTERPARQNEVCTRPALACMAMALTARTDHALDRLAQNAQSSRMS
jgi:hypothetical protein